VSFVSAGLRQTKVVLHGYWGVTKGAKLKVIKMMDALISEALRPLKEVAASIDIPERFLICSDIDYKVLLPKAGTDGLNYAGIYRIDVRTTGAGGDLGKWIKDLEDELVSGCDRKSYTPTMKKKRVSKHLELTEWMPLYLGKSKNVRKRVLEHVYLPLEKPTFALKLMARGMIPSRQFRVHALELQVENYDVIAPALELALRDKFNPLVGRQ